MGFTPRQVDEMTVWEFQSCVCGYQEAHGHKPKGGGGDVDDARLREMGIEGF